MNIVEAFIKYFNGVVIIISGLSGSNKTSIAKFIERDFKIALINIENYVAKENTHTVDVNGAKIADWDHIDSYDWTTINAEVAKHKSTGVVVCGPYFPSNKLDVDANFHIQIKVSKQTLIEKRYEYIKSNPSKFESLTDKLDMSIVASIVNQITYPHFIDYSQKSKIDKYVNSKDITVDQVYDQVADYLFYKITEAIKEHDSKKVIRTETSVSDKAIKSIKPTKQNKTKDDSDEEYYKVKDSSSSDVATIKGFDDSSDSTSLGSDEPVNPNRPVYLGELDNWDDEWKYVRTGTKIKDY